MNHKNKTKKLRVCKKRKTKIIGGELIDYDNGDKYEGDVIEVNGIKIKQGSGKIIYGETSILHEPGDVYEGLFVNDKASGKGKYTFVNGDVYEGDFLHDMAHGKGKFVFADGGATYEGDFFGNNKNGKGKYTYSNGNTYEGDFLNDRPHGRGILTLRDGNKYNKYDFGYKEGKQHGKSMLLNEDRVKDDIKCWENGHIIWAGDIQNEKDKECDGEVDPINYEKIPEGMGFRIYTDTTNNCYNRDTIKQLRPNRYGQVLSPFTRLQFIPIDIRRKKASEICYGGTMKTRNKKGKRKTNRRLK